MTILLPTWSVTTPRIRMGGLVASSATGSDRTSAIGWMSAAVSVPMAAAGDELRQHHAKAQARMTSPSFRNVLKFVVPIIDSLLSPSPDRSLFLHGWCRRPVFPCLRCGLGWRTGLDGEGLPSKPDARARESVLRTEKTAAILKSTNETCNGRAEHYWLRPLFMSRRSFRFDRDRHWHGVGHGGDGKP